MSLSSEGTPPLCGPRRTTGLSVGQGSFSFPSPLLWQGLVWRWHVISPNPHGVTVWCLVRIGHHRPRPGVTLLTAKQDSRHQMPHSHPSPESRTLAHSIKRGDWVCCAQRPPRAQLVVWWLWDLLPSTPPCPQGRWLTLQGTGGQSKGT